MAVEIVKVIPGGIGSELGLKEGNRIVYIDGNPVRDYLDFIFLSASDVISLTVEDEKGDLTEYIIEKGDQNLGIEVEYIKPKPCRCKCIFCFMDQMPKGLRKSLYFKDDDYRLSFLTGNYITLTNLSEEDYKRIEKQKLSPLYVSVHSTDPKIRSKMMRCKRASNIMTELKRLVELGITIHAQIVVCPGINDDEVLKVSLKDLFSLYPGVRSVAVVPVGLTKFRESLYPLRPVGKKEACEILNICLSFGEYCKKVVGSRFVFPSDELFIKAGFPIPSVDFYEDFYQIEDGIGMVSRFLHFAIKIKKDLSLKALFVTGEAFYPYLDSILKDKNFSNSQVVKVKNFGLGDCIDVAGLLFGKDIVDTLKAYNLNGVDKIFIPDIIFNDNGLTLDDYTFDHFKEIFRNKVAIVPSDPQEFVDFINSL